MTHTSTLGAGCVRSLLLLLKYLDPYIQPIVYYPDDGDLPSHLRELGVERRAVSYRWRNVPWLARQFQRDGLDLVYGNNLSGRVLLAFLAAKLVGRPFIWHVRETLTVMTGGRMKSLLLAGLRRADLVIAVSAATASSIHVLLPGLRVEVAHNGVELARFGTDPRLRQASRRRLGLSEETVALINIGRLRPVKNQGEILSILPDLAARHPNLRLFLLGEVRDPAYFEDLKRLEASLGRPDLTTWCGLKENIAEFTLGADIYVHTASADPFPRAILEAMASRLPVVAYDVDGIGEEVEAGVTGYLVPYGEREQLKSRVLDLISNPHLRTEMGISGHERVCRYFQPEATATAVSGFIREVFRDR